MCGGAVRGLPGGHGVRPRARARVGFADHREDASSDLVRAAPPLLGAAIPALPAAVPRGRPALRSLCVRPRHQLAPLRGQRGPGASAGAAHLLLPHPHAVPLALLRRILRSRPRVAADAPGHGTGRRSAAPLGRVDRVIATMVRRELGERAAQDPGDLPPRSRRDLSTRRNRSLPCLDPRRRVLPGGQCAGPIQTDRPRGRGLQSVGGPAGRRGRRSRAFQAPRRRLAATSGSSDGRATGPSRS